MAGVSWPEPRLRALQVEEIYRFAPTATGFSYFGALVTLGILIASGDIAVVRLVWTLRVTSGAASAVETREPGLDVFRRQPDGRWKVTLGFLIAAGDIGRGAVWFLWATAVTCFRCVGIVSYRRRAADSDPEAWGRLVIAANFLAGVQWGVLGTILFPDTPGYLQLFTLMVIILTHD